ncbi:hypothetical protein F4818DRAFT_48219 [Hypoxylon cercidicola]|nr:hypothetical protein F4818DRAFT_48219 [Hypoxylon cercidicola]
MEGASSTTAMPAGANILNIFLHKLNTEWKSKACCGREYYRTNDILKWMRSTDPNKQTSNTSRLLVEAHEAHRTTLKIPTSDEIDNQDSCCLKIFAILLELGCGHLIHAFQRYRIDDKNLPDLPNTEPLERDLMSKGHISNAKDFWERFQEKMWLYPCTLVNHMTSAFLDPGRGRWIMPFCKRQRVNHKGGTASVWEVAVQESLVPLGLAVRVSRSVYEDNDHGRCYTFALKSFSQENSEIFEWEKEAYLAVGDKPGMVQFLGEYEIDEKLEDGTVARTYNILLEYGEEDLEEFFASKMNYPPILNSETIQFWESLANVANALHSMHNLVLERQDGRHHFFSGWHCDLKPDNILRVGGEFKLADFGFAKFKPKYPDGGAPPEELKSLITGGTETYGAPECDIARRDPSKSVSQTIDNWSFGCVLSVSATWVVLGYQGVRAYHEQRRRAIKMRREKQQNGENITVPVADDAFHDGTDVLPEVREWHDHLRSVLRVSDTITGRILKVVDKHMLVTESARQSKSVSVHDALQEELRLARKDYDRLVSKGTIQPVAESVKEALLSVEDLESSPANSQVAGAEATNTTESPSFPEQSLAEPPRHQLKSSRINKHKRIEELPTGRVAHRQDALRPHQSNLIIGSQQGEPSCAPKRSSKTHRILRSALSADYTEKEPVIKGSSPMSNVYRVPTHTGYATPRIREQRPKDISSAEYSHTPREGHTPTRMDSHERAARAPIPLSLEIPRNQTFPPVSFYVNPSWPIAQEREAERSREKGVRARLGFGKKEDDFLKQFLVERDIMFLVDNDTSMYPYWEAMATVLETLVSKVDPLDKDGLDIEFTIGNTHSAHGVSGSKLITKFRGAKQEASSRPWDIGTDMAKTLNHIFDKYLRGARRATTLIILTDGLWRGTVDGRSVEMAIANFLKKPTFKEKLEKRWFTIQFISFGHQIPDILNHLDNEIGRTYSIPDVIDTEHVSGDVYKMILGSFVDMFDELTPSPISPPTPMGQQPTLSTQPTAPFFSGTPTTDPLAPSYPQPNGVTRQNSSRFSLKNIFT